MGLKGATSGTLTAYTNRTKPSSLEARALNSTRSPMMDSATVSVNQIRRTSLSATGYANGRSSIVTHADMIAQQARVLGPSRDHIEIAFASDSLSPSLGLRTKRLGSPEALGGSSLRGDLARLRGSWPPLGHN